MARYLKIGQQRKLVATEDELLEFVNKIRVIAQGDNMVAPNLLDKLLPAYPETAEACLIAACLIANSTISFECEITPLPYDEKDRNAIDHWSLVVYANAELAEKIGKEMGLKCRTIKNPWLGGEETRIDLPAHIGNAASAFDAGVAFQEYDRTKEEDDD